MTVSFKHIGLLIGLVLIFLSFLFFGRQQLSTFDRKLVSLTYDNAAANIGQLGSIADRGMKTGVREQLAARELEQMT